MACEGVERMEVPTSPLREEYLSLAGILGAKYHSLAPGIVIIMIG